MSRVTRIKHFQREVEADDLSLPTDNQQIVKVVSSKGNNLHEVESPDGEKFLVSMPTKFRKNIWIKRGSFILVESISEGDKVKGEIVRILDEEHQKEFSKHGVWPKKFTKKREYESDGSTDDENFGGNLNRRQAQQDNENDSSDSED